MRESMQDSFRQWYMEHKRVSGKFPEFPDDTIWQHPTFKFGAEPRKSLTSDGDTTAPTKKASKDNIKTPDDKKKKPKTSEEEIDENKFKFDGSKYIDTIKKGHDSYAQTWEKKEERENFAQKHDQDIIKNDKRKEVEAEVRFVWLYISRRQNIAERDLPLYVRRSRWKCLRSSKRSCEA